MSFERSFGSGPDDEARAKRETENMPSLREQTSGHDRIYEIILDEIVSGALAPGARLVESRLAERLEVSRTPIREALFRLHQDGFVLTDSGRGFSVKQLGEREARDLFPILSTLEGLALSLAAPLLTLDVNELRKANKALAPLSGRPSHAIAADKRFHELLVQRCSNTSLLEMIRTVRRRLLRYEYVYMSDETLIDVSMAQHEAIIDCIERCDFDGAMTALATNYESGKALVLSKLRGSGPV